MTTNVISPNEISQRPRTWRYVLPSAVSIARVLIALMLVSVMTQWPSGVLISALIGVPIVMFLDGLDGILARRLQTETVLGSFMDIVADRAVEFIFLQQFVNVHLIPLWFVVVFYGRILLTDSCRVLAFRMDKVSASGILLSSKWRPLVLSRFSRSAYATLKGVFFSVLMLGQYNGHTSLTTLETVIMAAVLAFSLLRATPILMTYLPRVSELVRPNLSTYADPYGSDIAPRSTTAFSCFQLLSDIGLATALIVIGLR
jgi:phosphatidylglycerophosphate synthase